MERKSENINKLEAALPTGKRRLDALAELLARGSDSTCVAMSIFNDRLIITSNDFFAGIKKNEGKNLKLQHIREILNYFQKAVSKTKITPEGRKKIFKFICSTDKPSIADTLYSKKLGGEKFESVIQGVVSVRPISSENCREKFSKAWKVAWDA